MTRAAAFEVRPLTARSAVLSLLLGSHPPELPVRQIVGVAQVFGIADATLRVALTRMVGAGDLERTDGTYRLSERLLDRQRRQDAALELRTRAWRGDWEMAVVTATGRSPGERARQRDQLAQWRFGELREGVWLRPDNLRRPRPSWAGVEPFLARRVTDPDALARALWDLDGWARTGSRLLRHFGSARAEPGLQLAAAAAIVRHLRTDPLLPPELLPARWPADELRRTYAAYQRQLIEVIRAAQARTS
jgi:phenylacetic acid degradation operon negative regulatory protein